MHRSKIVDQLRMNIIEGDDEIYPADLEVIARIHLIFFYDDPLLIEFCIMNICKHFKSLDFVGKVYSISYMLMISKVSEECLTIFLKELAPIYSGNEAAFHSEYEKWPLMLKFYFIHSLQVCDIIVKPEDQKAMIQGLLKRYSVQVIYIYTSSLTSIKTSKC
jgi:hypothetical protein